MIIIETLKYFRTILLGQKLIIYTDNKKITCKNLKNDRVIRQRLKLKEYGPYIKYIKGKKNVVLYRL